jgi:hypothetical protein
MADDTEKYGPHTDEVTTILTRIESLTSAQFKQLGVWWSAAFTVETDDELAERNTTRSAMFEAREGAACVASWNAVRTPLWKAVQKSIGRDPEGDVEFIASWNAIREAVSVTITQDVITLEQYRKLIGPWENVVGPITGVGQGSTRKFRL